METKRPCRPARRLREAVDTWRGYQGDAVVAEYAERLSDSLDAADEALREKVMARGDARVGSGGGGGREEENNEDDHDGEEHGMGLGNEEARVETTASGVAPMVA